MLYAAAALVGIRRVQQLTGRPAHSARPILLLIFDPLNNRPSTAHQKKREKKSVRFLFLSPPLSGPFPSGYWSAHARQIEFHAAANLLFYFSFILFQSLKFFSGFLFISVEIPGASCCCHLISQDATIDVATSIELRQNQKNSIGEITSAR